MCADRLMCATYNPGPRAGGGGGQRCLNPVLAPRRPRVLSFCPCDILVMASLGASLFYRWRLKPRVAGALPRVDPWAQLSKSQDPTLCLLFALQPAPLRRGPPATS